MDRYDHVADMGEKMEMIEEVTLGVGDEGSDVATEVEQTREVGA